MRIDPRLPALSVACTERGHRWRRDGAGRTCLVCGATAGCVHDWRGDLDTWQWICVRCDATQEV